MAFREGLSPGVVVLALSPGQPAGALEVGEAQTAPVGRHLDAHLQRPCFHMRSQSQVLGSGQLGREHPLRRPSSPTAPLAGRCGLWPRPLCLHRLGQHSGSGLLGLLPSRP